MLFLLLTAQLAASTTAVDALFLALPQPVGGLDRAAREALLKDPGAHVVVDVKNGFLHIDTGPASTVVEAAVFEGKSRVLLAVTVHPDCKLQYFHVYDVDNGFKDVTAVVLPAVTMAELTDGTVGGDEALRIEVRLPRHGTTIVATEAGTCQRMPRRDGIAEAGLVVSFGHIWSVGSIDLVFDGVGGFVKKKAAPH